MFFQDITFDKSSLRVKIPSLTLKENYSTIGLEVTKRNQRTDIECCTDIFPCKMGRYLSHWSLYLICLVSYVKGIRPVLVIAEQRAMKMDALRPPVVSNDKCWSFISAGTVCHNDHDILFHLNPMGYFSFWVEGSDCCCIMYSCAP